MQRFEQSRQMEPHMDEDVEAHMGTPLEPGAAAAPQASMTPVLTDDEDVNAHFRLRD